MPSTSLTLIQTQALQLDPLKVHLYNQQTLLYLQVLIRVQPN